jgi:hypothetical protein
VKVRQPETWKTPWGTLSLQSESARGEPRYHYAQWHSDSDGKPERPRAPMIGGHRRADVIRRIQRWVDEQWTTYNMDGAS